MGAIKFPRVHIYWNSSLLLKIVDVSNRGVDKGGYKGIYTPQILTTFS